MPVIYRARRVGLEGRTFSMLKFRSMHLETDATRKRITGATDPRVFRFGRIIRLLKLDELPQLINVVKGEMAVVGPRPEDPSIVADWYGDLGRETLRVRPGLTSPGTIYDYTYGERLLGNEDPEGDYVKKLLSTRLALDVVFIRRLTLVYELRIIGRTVFAILAMATGFKEYPDPPELQEALELMNAGATAGQVSRELG